MKAWKIPRKLIAAALVAGAVATASSPARASGGFFAPAGSLATVTEHRIVVAVWPSGVTLWDQMDFAGSPSDFAWILPTPTPATVALADKVFFDTLDDKTAPTVRAPAPQAVNEGGGCAAATYDNSVNDIKDAGMVSAVLQDHVIFPYVMSAFTAPTGDAAVAWLEANNYVVPDAIKPAIAAYAKKGWVFNALRFMPGVTSLTQTQPVRVTCAGCTSPVLPLRMTAAGAQPTLGLTIWVFGSQRMDVSKPYASVVIDPSTIDWLPDAGTSDYSAVFSGALAAPALNGLGFVTEYSNRIMDTDLVNVANTDALAALGGETSATLTRLRTRLSPSLLTDDLTIVHSFNVTPVSRAFTPAYIYQPPTAASLPPRHRGRLPSLALAAFVGLGLLRRRRRS